MPRGRREGAPLTEVGKRAGVRRAEVVRIATLSSGVARLFQVPKTRPFRNIISYLLNSTGRVSGGGPSYALTQWNVEM